MDEEASDSIIIKKEMARTLDYLKLAKIAHIMDNFTREENDKLERANKILKDNMKWYENKLKIMKNQYNHLRNSWEDLANTVNELGIENARLQLRVRNLEERLLDEESTEQEELPDTQSDEWNERMDFIMANEESDPEWEANIDYFEERDHVTRRLEF